MNSRVSSRCPQAIVWVILVSLGCTKGHKGEFKIELLIVIGGTLLILKCKFPRLSCFICSNVLWVNVDGCLHNIPYAKVFTV